MGAAGSVLEQEASKPLDASDIKNGEEGALEEVVRLRLLLKQHYEATPQPQMTEGTEKKADDPGGVSMQAPMPKKPAAKDSAEKHLRKQVSVKPFGKELDFSKYTRGNENFRFDQAPQLLDFLTNEYWRFCGQDQVLSWEEFWRLMKELDLGLSDIEIGELRQAADTNADGVIEWEELIKVVEPLIAKFWRASVENAHEYDQWKQLHWEVHDTLTKVQGGDGEEYTRKDGVFWVNRLTGESTWEKPAVLVSKPSIVDQKASRLMQAAPSLDNFLAGVFTAKTHKEKGKYDMSEDTLTPSQFVEIIVSDLNIQPPPSAVDLMHLKQEADKNHDGKINWVEFSSTITPLLQRLFAKQGEDHDWVALEDKFSDSSGHEETFLYFYNRTTGESSWTKPDDTGGKRVPGT